MVKDDFFLSYFVFCKLILLIFVLLASKLLEIVSRITSNHPQVFVYPIIFAHFDFASLKILIIWKRVQCHLG